MTPTQWLWAAVALLTALEVAHFLYNHWRFAQMQDTLDYLEGRRVTELEERITKQNDALYKVAKAVDVLEVDDDHPTVNFGFKGRYRIKDLKTTE